MNRIINILATIFICSYSFSQTQVDKISRNNFIGQRIKFLRDNQNKYGYQGFCKTKNCYPSLSYSDFNSRTATFVGKENDLFTLKMDDSGELILFKHYSFSDIPNNIGFFSLLDSAKSKYLNKVFYTEDYEQCKIVAIEFAEDKGEYAQLYGPYNVYYTIGIETTMVNVHFTDTYGPEKGYTEYFQKHHVFENIFELVNSTNSNKNPNIVDNFIVDIDKMDEKTTYIHKDLAKRGIIYNEHINVFGYENKSILTKVVIINGEPQISFISNYCGSSWLFHTFIKIRIGDKTKQTTPVKGKTEILKDGNVVETNYYKLPTDLTILTWIANNYTKDITIRFYGKDYCDDLNVPPIEKKAIKETYDLFNYLKAR